LALYWLLIRGPTEDRGVTDDLGSLRDWVADACESHGSPTSYRKVTPRLHTTISLPGGGVQRFGIRFKRYVDRNAIAFHYIDCGTARGGVQVFELGSRAMATQAVRTNVGPPMCKLETAVFDDNYLHHPREQLYDFCARLEGTISEPRRRPCPRLHGRHACIPARYLHWPFRVDAPAARAP
jgi:hypothetical protein